jgi:thymidylate synthase
MDEEKDSIFCCLATDDGIVWDAASSFGMQLGAELRQLLDMDDDQQMELTVLAPSLADFTLARNASKQLVVLELPAAAGRGRPSTSATLNLGDVLTCRDRVELMVATPGARVILVDLDAVHKVCSGEVEYLHLLGELLRRSLRACLRPDRTGTGTYSVFGRQLRFDLSTGIPLLTTKKLAWTKVLEELLWFARGETDVRDLQQRGVHIWDGNSSRGYLDSMGLGANAEGDIGPAYGFQWRHFGAAYTSGPKSGDMAKYAGQGCDQLAEVERLLKEEPSSRRIILNAWNAADVKSMALPPCHVMAQFYVKLPPPGRSTNDNSNEKNDGDSDGDGDSGGVVKQAKPRLSCHLYQRSVDTFLGFPWNIASYAMLTSILAVRAGMLPDELIISTGDTHIYSNHIDAAVTQLCRSPRPMPHFVMSNEVATKSWDQMTVDDFMVVGYYPHPPIKASMSV